MQYHLTPELPELKNRKCILEANTVRGSYKYEIFGKLLLKKMFFWYGEIKNLEE